MLSDEDVDAQLHVDPASSGAHLEELAGRELRAALTDEGTLERLGARGFDPVVAFNQDEAGRHVLRITDGVGGDVIAEAVGRFARVRYRPDERYAHRDEPLAVIVLDWLLLQDPRARFTAERPPLPGQQHPGLGAGDRALALLDRLATALGREAVLAFPSHYHNAHITAEAFRFIDPVRQGELLALQRDLAGLSLAEASWAVELGLITEPAGTQYRWSAEEMAHATSPRVEDYLHGKPYEREAHDVADALSFDVDAEAARAHVAKLGDERAS